MRPKRLLFAAALIAAASGVEAMERVWTRPTGQFPVEAAPLLADLDGDGDEDILILNRGGQLLHWNGGGDPVGPGQDGAAFTLPAGLWTSSLTRVVVQGENLFVACNQDGLVIAVTLDGSLVWQYQLPGKPQYSRAVPALLESPDGTLLYFTDQSGSLTCLDVRGKKVFSVDLGFGPGRAPPQVLRASGLVGILAAVGAHLVCVQSANGMRMWAAELGDPILSRPEVVTHGDVSQIVCGGGSGSLFGMKPTGEIEWEFAIGDEIDSSITLLPRSGNSPLVLFTGVWGNLYAVDIEGRAVWTALFEAKTRARPLIADVDHDGEEEIYVPTYSHRLYAFDSTGNLIDEVRLTGIVNAPLVAVSSGARPGVDVLAVSAANMGYRLAAGQALGPYRDPGNPKGVDLTIVPPSKDLWTGERTLPGLQVENPNGAVLRVRATFSNRVGRVLKWGRLTAFSKGSWTLPEEAVGSDWSCAGEVIDASGNVICTGVWKISDVPASTPIAPLPDSIRIIPTMAYSTEAPEEPLRDSTLRVSSLYRREVDQGSFLLASSIMEPMTVRITLDPLTTENGRSFQGETVLRQVVGVDAVNGERVGDALPPLGPSGLVQLVPGEVKKVWITVDAVQSAPGVYGGVVRATPLDADIPGATAEFVVEVVDLELPSPPAMKLCTWDYVPNNWFPAPANRAFEDMAKHGVNVFPRNHSLPEATCDEDGNLELDWSVADKELARLKDRGTLLLHVYSPPIRFAEGFRETDRRAVQVKYLRQVRDQLAERGWDASEYLFYPVDEPGFDFGKRVDVFMEAATLLKEADSAFRIYTNPVMALSQADFDRMDPFVDVWAPNLRLASGSLCGDPRTARMGDRGREVWSYECLAQVKSLSPIRYNRSAAWRARYFGLSGIGLWTHCTTPNDPWLRGKGINDEYALVYPGEEPVPSVRWEALRDGVEDIAALEILESLIQRAEGRSELSEEAAAARNLIRIGLNDALDRSDEAFIESRDFLRPGRRRIWHTQVDVEQMEEFRRRAAECSIRLKDKLKG